MIAAVCEEALDAARRAAPAGVEVRELPPDGFDAAALQQVSFIVPGWMSGGSLDVLAELPELRVVQVLSAGTDWIESRVPEWATLCNARGTRDIPMAEWALAALVGATTGLLQAARDRSWDYIPPAELHGQTVLVVGHGSIGRHWRRGWSRWARMSSASPATPATACMAPSSCPTCCPRPTPWWCLRRSPTPPAAW
jgi:phosphoglycerate dehydrogenase-like enzyme